jgi:hypothetical protein
MRSPSLFGLGVVGESDWEEGCRRARGRSRQWLTTSGAPSRCWTVGGDGRRRVKFLGLSGGSNAVDYREDQGAVVRPAVGGDAVVCRGSGDDRRSQRAERRRRRLAEREEKVDQGMRWTCTLTGRMRGVEDDRGHVDQRHDHPSNIYFT